MDTNQGSSRRRLRRFMRTAPVTNMVAGVDSRLSTGISPIDQDVMAAARVVQANFSKESPGDMELAIRVSVVTQGYGTRTLDVHLDNVPFDLPPAAIKNLIVRSVRARISEELGVLGTAVIPEQIAVQVAWNGLDVNRSTMTA